MVETSEKNAVQQGPEKSSSEKVHDEVHKLYQQLSQNNGTQDHIALANDVKTLQALPSGGVSVDGSISFGGKFHNNVHDGGTDGAIIDGGKLRGILGDKAPVFRLPPPGGDSTTKQEVQPGIKTDKAGHVTEVDYPNGQSRKFGYDKQGNLTSITQPDGSVIVRDGDGWKYKEADSKNGGRPAPHGDANPAGGTPKAPGEQGEKQQQQQQSNDGKSDKKGIEGLLGGLGGIVGGGMEAGKRTPDIKDPKVGPDGTFTYSTGDGSQHSIKPDGTHDVKKTDGSSLTQDADGRTTSVDYGNGQKRTFEYNNGQVSSVHDADGTVYTNKNGRWYNGDKLADKQNFSVDNQGNVSYQDKDGARITQHTDRTSDVTNANGSSMHRDADGHITEEKFSNGQTRKIEYNGNEPSKITEPDGSVVTRDAQGNWSDGRKDVKVDNDGTLHYTNKDNHVVIDGTDGTRRTSDKTADELAASADKLHTLLGASLPLLNYITGPMVKSELEGLSPTDRALVAQEYEKKYGKPLTDVINSSLTNAEAGECNKLVYSAQLQEYALRHIPDSPGSDGKNQRQAFMDNMNEFMNRAQRDGVSDREVADTMGQILRIGNASDSKVTGEERTWLTEQIMHNAAHPDQIDQGGHGTCNVTDVEMLAYTRNPSQAARMVADVALTGEYTATDGKKITIPPQNLIPDGEARVNPPDDGRRGFASQIFQATALNDASQRWNPPKYFAGLPPGGGADVGDYWTDANGNPLLREKKDDKGNTVMGPDGKPVMEKDTFGGLGYHEINDEVKRLTGQEHSVLVSWKDGQLHSFETQDDLRNIIQDAQKNGKMPLIIDVTGDDKLFGGNKPVGDKDRHGGNHVVVIRDYNPSTGMVRVDNSWGSGNDKWVPLSDLYNASK